MPTVAEECYIRSKALRAKAEEEKDPDKQQEMIETADEYAELVKLLQDA